MNSPTFELRRWYERTSKNGSNWGRSGWRMLNLVEDKKNSTAIYDQNGKLILEDAANGLNTHLNALLKQIVDKSNTINNW
ncbi:hypothetical protein D3C87_1597000 [compost metagenome]